MTPAIETDRKPTPGIELIAKVQCALERTDLTRIRTHDVSLANRYVIGYLRIVA